MESAGPLLHAVPAPGGKLRCPSSLGSAKPILAKNQMKCSAVGKLFIGGSLQEPVPIASGTAHPGASLATFSSAGMEPGFAGRGDRRWGRGRSLVSSRVPGCLPGLLRRLSGAVGVAGSVSGGTCWVWRRAPSPAPAACPRGRGWDVEAWGRAASLVLSAGGKKHGEGVSSTHGWGPHPFVGTWGTQGP